MTIFKYFHSQTADKSNTYSYGIMHFTVAVERMGEPMEFLDGNFGLNDSRMRNQPECLASSVSVQITSTLLHPQLTSVVTTKTLNIKNAIKKCI